MMARTAYSASKAGMNAFARALALEVDRDGIAVHIVTPGPVETEMLQDVPFEMNAIAAVRCRRRRRVARHRRPVSGPAGDPAARGASAARSRASPSCPTRLAAVPLSVNEPGPLSRERLDHRFAEFVQRFRGGEISEPDIEPLDPLTGQITEMSDQLVGVAADQARIRDCRIAGRSPRARCPDRCPSRTKPTIC